MKFVTATTVSTNAGAISNSTTLVLPTTAAPAIADDMRMPVMNLLARTSAVPATAKARWRLTRSDLDNHM